AARGAQRRERTQSARVAALPSRRNGTSTIKGVPVISHHQPMTMSTPRILMCPPDFYGIEYEINPWMSRSHGSDRPTAVAQWNNLVAILRGLGAMIDVLTPQPGLPDLVFTANAGVLFHGAFYSARFRHSERARESPVFDAWFAANGFEVK